jgi:hypothetical protein
MTPQGAKKVQQARDFLAKQAPQRQKIVAQLTQMVRNNQFEAAEKKIDSTFYDMETVLAFLGAHERGEIYKPFEQVSGLINQAMSQVRGKQAVAARDRLTQQALSERDMLLKRVQAGAAQLPQKGTIEVDGKQLEGPQAIAEFGKSWGAVHVGLMKCAAMHYGTRTSSYGDGGYSGSDDSSEYNRWSSENQKLADGVRQGFIAIITAEANAAPQPMARKRYVEYVQALSMLAGRIDNPSWLESLAPSLEQLATKGQMKMAVDAYQAATHDLLRWRARIAAAQHQAASKEFPILSQEAPKRLTVGEGKPEGFYSQQYHLPHMVTYVAQSVPKCAEQMLKLKVQAPQVARMDGKDGVVFTRFDHGLFMRLPAQMRAEKGIAELASDLLLTSDHPPLTLEAAVAVSSAQRGEFQAVGGEIVGMDVGGVITRFATLPPIAGNFVSCDRIQTSWTKVGELPGLCLQFSVMPEWVCHKYFFAKAIVPPPAANPAPDTSPKTEGGLPPAASPKREGG